MKILIQTIKRDFRDTIHFIRHDQSVEARLYYAIVVIFAVAAAAQVLIAILQGVGILQITTDTTTALISH